MKVLFFGLSIGTVAAITTVMLLPIDFQKAFGGLANTVSAAVGSALDSAPLVIENTPPPEPSSSSVNQSESAPVSEIEPESTPVPEKKLSVIPQSSLRKPVALPVFVESTSPSISQTPAPVIVPAAPKPFANPVYDPIPVPVNPGFGAGGGGSTALTTSGVSTPSVPADTTAPDVSLSVSACSSSLASDSCILLSGSSLSALLSSSASDFSSFTLGVDSVFSVTTATSTSLTLAEGTHTIALSAVDTTGNRSATTTQNIEVRAQPVVLNELSYFGTPASPDDEWIELYNRTGGTINLSGWTLYAGDGTPYLQLSGSVAGGGYYLIERKNSGETNEATESPIADVTADLWTSFGNGLDNGGEHLYLSYYSGTATSTIDEMDFSACGGWCGIGGGGNYLSMERKSPDVSGLTDSGWAANRGDRTDIKNGHDQSGTALRATPKAKNYANYLVNGGDNLTSGTLTLTATGSPYFIDNTQFTIASGATLTLQAGAVVKFLGTAGIKVNGNLTANGTASSPSIFTSYYDDTYGTDFNRDGSATSPTAGDWYGIEYLSGSSGTLSYSTIRYGGKFNGTVGSKANVYITNASPTISNSTIEYGKTYGISLDTASSTVSSNAIRYHTTDTPSYGIYGSGGAPTISSNTLSSNSYGMAFWDTTGTISSNTFTNNTNGALTFSGGLTGAGRIQNNTGSGNGVWNGIRLPSGNLLSSGATSTFSANTNFPYLLPNTATIPMGAGLIAEAGSVWKTDRFSINVYGRIETQGTLASPVLFTNWYDDSDGSDVHANGSTTPSVLNPSGIYLKPNSTSDFLNTSIRYMDNGLNYDTSPISLENVSFIHNGTGVSASGSSVVKAINVSFEGNAATSTMPLQ